MSWTWLEDLKKATKQEEQEEVWGWRSICQSSRMKRPRMLWYTIQVVGHSYFLPPGLGWPTLVAIHLQSLQGFPGDLVRSLGKDATLTDILQMLDEYYGVVMTFNALSKELYSLNKVPGRMCLGSECTCHCRFRYFRRSIWEWFNRSMWRRWNEIISMRAWTPNISTCWPTKWMVNSPLVSPTCSLQPRSWKDGQKPKIPCSQRQPQLEDQMLLGQCIGELVSL